MMSTLLLRDFYLRNPAADVTGLLGKSDFGDYLSSPFLTERIALWRVYTDPNAPDDARMLAHLVVMSPRAKRLTDPGAIEAAETVLHFRPTRVGWRAVWRIARMLARGGFAHVPSDPGPALVMVDLCADHKLAIGEVVHRGQP